MHRHTKANAQDKKHTLYRETHTHTMTKAFKVKLKMATTTKEYFLVLKSKIKKCKLNTGQDQMW